MNEKTQYNPVEVKEIMAYCHFSKHISDIILMSSFTYFSKVSEPLELVGMDLVGKLTLTCGGNLYICVIVDYFTKWAEAYSLKSKTAVKVTNCILNLFYKFGAPKRLLTDQGSEFCKKGQY